MAPLRGGRGGPRVGPGLVVGALVVGVLVPPDEDASVAAARRDQPLVVARKLAVGHVRAVAPVLAVRGLADVGRVTGQSHAAVVVRGGDHALALLPVALVASRHGVEVAGHHRRRPEALRGPAAGEGPGGPLGVRHARIGRRHLVALRRGEELDVAVRGVHLNESRILGPVQVRQRELTSVIRVVLAAQRRGVGVGHGLRLVHESVAAVRAVEDVEDAELAVLARDGEELTVGGVSQVGDGSSALVIRVDVDVDGGDDGVVGEVDDGHLAVRGAARDVLGGGVPRDGSPRAREALVRFHPLLLQRPDAQGAVLADGGKLGLVRVHAQPPDLADVLARARVDRGGVALDDELGGRSRHGLRLRDVNLENLGGGRAHGEGPAVHGGGQGANGGRLAALERQRAVVLVHHSFLRLGEVELEHRLHEHAPQLDLAILARGDQRLAGEAHVVDRAVVHAGELANRTHAPFLVLVHVSLDGSAKGAPVGKKRQREHRARGVPLSRAVRVHSRGAPQLIAVHGEELQGLGPAHDQAPVRGVPLHAQRRRPTEDVEKRARDELPTKGAAVLLRRVRLPLVHRHGVLRVRADAGEVPPVRGEGEEQHGRVVRAANGRDPLAIRRSPHVDGGGRANLSGGDVAPGGVHDEARDVVVVQIEEVLLARLRVHRAADARGVVAELAVVGVSEVGPAVVRAVSVDKLELQGVVRELQGVRGELVGVLRGFVEVMRARHDVVLAAEGLQREPALSRVQRRNPGGRRLLGGDEPLVVGGEVGVVPLVLHRFVRVDLGFGEDALGAELPGRRARAHGDFASVHSRLTPTGRGFRIRELRSEPGRRSNERRPRGFGRGVIRAPATRGELAVV